MPTSQQKSNKVYKKLFSVADTRDEREIYEEPYPSRKKIFAQDIYSDPIPTSAPLNYVTDISGATSGPITIYKDITLNHVIGDTNAFYHPLLINSIPFNYGDGSYNYLLKTNTGIVIPFGAGDWDIDNDSGVLRFYSSTLPFGISATNPPNVSFFRYEGNFGQGLSGKIGTPTDGIFGTEGLIGLDQNDTYADGFDKVAGSIEKLIPERPPPLSTKSLILTNEYDAIRAINPYNLVTNVSNNAEINVTGFGDSKNGTLELLINSNSEGSIALTDSDNSGIVSPWLEITRDDDFYPSTPGKSGFWNSLDVRINDIFPPSNVTNYTVELNKSDTFSGNAVPITFWKEDTTLSPLADNPQIISVTGTSRFVSGVPTLVSGTNSFRARITATNCVRRFYNKDWVARVFGTNLMETTILPSGTQRNEFSDPTFDIYVTPKPNSYSENEEFNFEVQNSAGETATNSVFNKARIDTISIQPTNSEFTSELNRVPAGSGLYPTLNTSIYPSNQNLQLNYELQLLGGYYQYPPAVDYSSKIPNGPNYSSLLADTSTGDYRYAAFNLGTITDRKYFYLEIKGLQNHSFVGNSTLIFKDTILQIHLVGSPIGILNANRFIKLCGTSPSANNDGCLSNIDSTATKRRISFGNNLRSGTLIVRIGIKNTNSMRFTGIKLNLS